MRQTRRHPQRGRTALPVHQHLSRKNQLAIEVISRQNRVRVGTINLRTLLGRVGRLEGLTHGHIEVVLLDDDAIRDLHREYLNIDTPTDVLTFQLNEPGEPLAGLIVVSAETAEREAARRRLTAKAEVLLYAIHGVLHLCGYDDQRSKDARRMHRRQMQLLRYCQRSHRVRTGPRPGKSTTRRRKKRVG